MLTLLQKTGANLTLKKSRFFTDTINNLGHAIRTSRLEIASPTTDSNKRLEEPRNVTELRILLGLWNLFKRFALNITHRAAPLNRKLKEKPKKFGPLNNEDRKATKTVREKLISPPILALPYARAHFTLDTVPCDVQAGCMLWQKQNNRTREPIFHWSRSLTKAEKGCDTTRREYSAEVWWIPLLDPYSKEHWLTIRTNHESLRRLLNLIDALEVFALWGLTLLRLATRENDKSTLKDHPPVMCINKIDDTRHFCSKYVRKDTTSTLMQVKSEPNDLNTLTLSELVKAQGDDGFCQQSPKHVNLSGTEFPFYLRDEHRSTGQYRNRYHGQCNNEYCSSHTIHLLQVFPHSEVCMTLCAGTATGPTWHRMCTTLWAAVQAV